MFLDHSSPVRPPAAVCCPAADDQGLGSSRWDLHVHSETCHPSLPAGDGRGGPRPLCGHHQRLGYGHSRRRRLGQRQQRLQARSGRRYGDRGESLRVLPERDNFYDWVRVDDQNLKPAEDGKVHIKVRAAGDAGSCSASLAAYRTHGATFKTSGEQVFHDFDSVKVKPGGAGLLDIAVPDAGCYAQIDLYRGAVKFDGKLDANDGFEHGDLPKGPDRAVIKDKLIMAWNGGKKDCTAQPPSTHDHAPGLDSAGLHAARGDPGRPDPDDARRAVDPGDDAGPPVGLRLRPRRQAPSPNGGQSTPPGDLAETGGGNTLPIAAGAAALVVAGGAITVVARRRRSTRAARDVCRRAPDV